jgi:hypothetical protein
LKKTVGKLGSSVENPNVVFLSPGAGNETFLSMFIFLPT